jgi:hypothetical protein
MVLVGDDGRLVKRYGLVTEPETILRDYRKARASWARELAFVRIAAERGPMLVVVQGTRFKAAWFHQMELLDQAALALLERDVAVIGLDGQVPECWIGSRERLPGTGYFERRYSPGQKAVTFELLLIAPDGHLLKRFSAPVGQEQVLKAIDAQVPL